MSLRYRLMYRVGFAPWDTEEVPAELQRLVEGPDALPPGGALDLGCGTGTQAVYLAGRGWRTTAVDSTPQALESARRRAEAARAEVDFRRADVGRLSDLGLEPGYGLLFDRGCFHDIPAQTRAGYADGVTELAAPGATLLLMSFAPNRRPGPAGADRAELEERFGAAWDLVAAEPDSGPDPSGPMRTVPRHWYRFERH